MRRGLTRWRNTAIIKASLPRRLRRSGRSGQQSGRTPSSSGRRLPSGRWAWCGSYAIHPFPPQTKTPCSRRLLSASCMTGELRPSISPFIIRKWYIFLWYGPPNEMCIRDSLFRQLFLCHFKRQPPCLDICTNIHFFHLLTITAIKAMSVRITAAFTMISSM